MTKKAILTSLAAAACLATIGTAYAGDDNEAIVASPAPVPVASAASEMTTRGGSVDIGAVFEETRIDSATLLRAPLGDQARLDVKMHVDLCSGTGCQKKYQFQITCIDEHGYVAVIDSPWYRNYATDGDVTKSYTFEDDRSPYCEKVESIDVAFEYGWQDTSG